MVRLNILLTNDDGIEATGLWSAAEALQEVGRVTVVAPDRDQSGIGTAKSLQAPVRTRRFHSPLEGVEAIAVKGTPADCVILATESLFPEEFDLVISGINEGANLGLDIMSSGTVGGALQGYYRDIPSIAVSVASVEDVRFDAAARATQALAQAIGTGKSAFGGLLLLNVNLPNVAPNSIQRVEVTRLGPRAYMENVERQSDRRGATYRILHNRRVGDEAEAGTDVWAVRSNCVSITPLNGLLSTAEGSAVAEALAAQVARTLGV